MTDIEESSRGRRILLYQGFGYRMNLEKNDTIYWRCCVGKGHTPIRTNIFKNSDATRAYGVGKHNRPGDRSNAYGDNTHCDANACYDASSRGRPKRTQKRIKYHEYNNGINNYFLEYIL